MPYMKTESHYTNFREARHEANKASVCIHDTMAGNNKGDGIVPYGSAHRLTGHTFLFICAAIFPVILP